jgi:hypothetical protein
MNSYTVTIKLPDEKSFMKFLGVAHPFGNQMILTVEHEDEPAAMEQDTDTPARPRQQRTSKVNQTILNALKDYDCTVKDLKEALEKANLSSGSLSTGLSILQKNGSVIRTGEGVYGLAERSQARAAE